MMRHSTEQRQNCKTPTKLAKDLRRSAGLSVYPFLALLTDSPEAFHLGDTMGKKGKKAQAGKPKKLTPKDVGKRLDVLVKKVEEELKDADLFKPLPPTEDCAVCLVPLPYVKCERRYQPCCGNTICNACGIEHEESIKKQNEENTSKKVAKTCPFCRKPRPTFDEENFHRLQARCLQNDHTAFTVLGAAYRKGDYGKRKNELKALDCWIQAVELGSAGACLLIGDIYHHGNGVAFDKERATLFERVAALRGIIEARHKIGCLEYYGFGNHEIGVRHLKIAAEAGHQNSLNQLRGIYNADSKEPGKEFISKEYLDFAHRACHEAQMEVKTEEREKHRSEE